MFKEPKKNNISRKEFLLFGIGLITIGIATFLAIFVLTFLIKKINISLKALPTNSSELHFNISGAKKLFPSLKQDSVLEREAFSSTSSTTVSTSSTISTTTSSTP